MITVALDTDIGTDVDDLLALAVILGSPELDLQAVTTVYGDTALRARMVHRAYALAGRPAPPIAGGARETRSGKAVWWAGHEGVLMTDLDREPFEKSLDATSLLRASGVVAAIGPPEHNLQCDVTAAQAVFESGTRALVTGIDQTERVVLSEDQIETIEASGPLGTHLAAEISQFRRWLGRPDSPHDAVAVLAKVRPELFTFATGTVRVDSAGNTSLQRQDDGPHQVVTDLDPGVVTRDLVSRIRRAAWPGMPALDHLRAGE